MATALDLLSQRQQEDWIHIWDNQGQLRPELTAQSLAADAQWVKDWLIAQDWRHCDRVQPAEASLQTALAQPVVLLAVADPALFLVWFSAVTDLGYPLFLADPAWGLSHWQQIALGLVPSLIITDLGWTVPNCLQAWQLLDARSSDARLVSCQILCKTHSFPQPVENCGKRSNLPLGEDLNSLYLAQSYPKPVESLWIGIPTGGSSGQLRFALHRWSSLTASAIGLQESDITGPTGQIHSCCTLPLHHVSGLMQFVRSLLSGGTLWLLPWLAVKAHFQGAKIGSPKIGLPENSSIGNEQQIAVPDQTFTFGLKQFFISLVPTQFQALIESPQGGQWLASFNTVLLGGAPAGPALLEQARRHAIRLAPTYGMTETASQIITLHPDDFLRGQSGCGRLLPHAQVEWLDESGGILVVRARSLAMGYYSIQSTAQATNPAAIRYSGLVELWAGPADLTDAARKFVTDDLVHRDEQGFFHVLGRASDKIISGGENIFPASVEAAILVTELAKDAVVVGIADPIWGERVVAIVVLATDLANGLNKAGQVAIPSDGAVKAQLDSAISPLLAPAQRPKQWHIVQAIPRTPQGKVQRRQLRTWLESINHQTS